MNYVNVDVLRSAAAEAFERKGGRVPCDRRPDPGTPPCGNRVEYLVADATRSASGGEEIGSASGGEEIERTPQWRCREHLELGEAPREQPIFQLVENNPEPPE